MLTAPQTPATRNLIGAAELALMKETAVIVNVSRGALIDEDALADALRRRGIAAAALDVFRDEPLEPATASGPCRTCSSRRTRPDSAPTTGRRRPISFAENLRRFDAGEPLINVVDKAEGY